MFTQYFLSANTKLITPVTSKNKGQLWDKNYDVWLEIDSINLSKKLAEEFA